jgi:hypothetical protein
MPRVRDGFAFREHGDGSRSIIVEKGEDARPLKAADEIRATVCKRCMQPIGTDRPYHLVNGEPVHREPCCRVF